MLHINTETGRFHAMYKKATVYGVLVALCAGIIPTSAIAQKQAFSIQEDYTKAFTQMTTGDAYEGAVTLVAAFRECPGDDARLTDELVGPAQLLAFSAASLMDWPQRNQMLEEVLDPKEHEFDRLFVAAMKAGSGIDSMALPAYGELMQLAKSDHLAIKLTALYILAEPYFYKKFPQQEAAIAEMVLAYPDLQMTRHLVEMPVWGALKAASKRTNPAIPAPGELLQQVRVGTGAREDALRASPGLRKMAESAPTLSVSEISDTTVANWAEAARNDPDESVRYAMLCALDSVAKTPERQAHLRTALTELASTKAVRTDTVRARVMLASLERAEHKPEALREAIRDILPATVLPCTPERSLYEATLHAVQHAAKYYTRYGHVADAINAHEMLAKRFPNTALAKTEQLRAEKLRKEGIQVTLEMLRREAREASLRGRSTDALRVYEDVLAHTQSAGLAADLEREIARLNRAQEATRPTQASEE